MADWETCPAVESVPGRLSGAWVFKDTRVPVSSLFANLAACATVEDFLDWFPGVEAWQVKAVLEHEVRHLDSRVEHPNPVLTAERLVEEIRSGELRGVGI